MSQNQNTTKVNEYYAKLVDGVEATMNSERWKKLLEVQSRFHNYSANNTLLIYCQMSEATRVASMKTWNKLGRKINKGSHAIKIFFPNFRTLWEEKKDAQGNVVKDAQGKPVKMKKEILSGFYLGNVFDVTQTNGKDLPKTCTELKGDDQAAVDLMNALLQVIPNQVIEDSKIKKWSAYDSTTGAILLKKGAHYNQKAKALVNAYVYEVSTEADISKQQIIAESVAFIVSNRYGLNTSAYSFDYISGFVGDLDALLDLSSKIQRPAEKIIKDLEPILNPQAPTQSQTA